MNIPVQFINNTIKKKEEKTKSYDSNTSKEEKINFYNLNVPENGYSIPPNGLKEILIFVFTFIFLILLIIYSTQ